MWNDTDTPIAFLITFRCYGTWLHGDSRGSTDRFNNAFGAPHIPQNTSWEQYNLQNLKRPPVKLGMRERKVIEAAIRETCSIRNWILMAINVRTNHVHVVAYPGGRKPEAALNAFKANATRSLRDGGLWGSESSPWADKGSYIYLWTERNVAIAVEYVVNGQGCPLPDFE